MSIDAIERMRAYTEMRKTYSSELYREKCHYFLAAMKEMVKGIRREAQCEELMAELKYCKPENKDAVLEKHKTRLFKEFMDIDFVHKLDVENVTEREGFTRLAQDFRFRPGEIEGMKGEFFREKHCNDVLEDEGAARNAGIDAALVQDSLPGDDIPTLNCPHPEGPLKKAWMGGWNDYFNNKMLLMKEKASDLILGA